MLSFSSSADDESVRIGSQSFRPRIISHASDSRPGCIESPDFQATTASPSCDSSRSNRAILAASVLLLSVTATTSSPGMNLTGVD